MAQKRDSTPCGAYKDTKKWLQQSFVAWIIVTVVVGIVSAIFAPINDTFICRVVFGAIGSIVALFLIFGISYLIFLIQAPYKKLNEAHKEIKKLELEKENTQFKNRIKGDLNMLLYEGKEALKGFKSAQNANQLHSVYWPVDEFKNWTGDGIEILQKYKLHDDAALWFKDVSVDISGALLNDYIEACNNGLKRIEKIIDRLSS